MAGRPPFRLLPLLIALLGLPAALPAQQGDGDIVGVIVPSGQPEARSRLELSRSRDNYPVTPGDSYRLTYRSAGREVASDVLVESDYTVDLNLFGKLNAEGMTFPQLKTQVEKIIGAAYPNSLPYLSITAVGMFQVYVEGEVKQTRFVNVWGLSHLSEALQDNLSPYSSLRDVRIRSRGGQERSYDLFGATVRGAAEQDPFVRLGDTIIVRRREREVEIQGEVARPGRYQLLAGDSLQEVVEYYGGGFTVLADRSHVRLLRWAERQPASLHLDLGSGYGEAGPLLDGDVLTVPSKLSRLAVIVFEGAVGPPGGAAAGEAAGEVGEPYGRVARAFAEGDTLYDALLGVRESLDPSADLSGSYLVRRSDGQILPVDLEALLARREDAPNPGLAPGDRVVIPSRRYLVLVTGAVNRPGAYQYLPQRPASYYVRLAGGINPDLNSGNRLSVRDPEGRRRHRKELVQAGDRVYVRTNDFLYNFNRYFPVVSSGIALVTSILTLRTLVDLLGR